MHGQRLRALLAPAASADGAGEAAARRAAGGVCTGVRAWGSFEMVQPASGELVKQRELLGLPGFGWWCEAGQDVTRKLACFIKQGIKVG